MKALLIKASAPGPFKKYKKAMGAPPQNIFSVAAATPGHVSLELCDETIGMKPDLRTDADVVALFFHTPDAPHAYALADKFRARGRTVVLGGLHPTFMPEEAGRHADAVLMGETEGIWEELLADVEAGDPKPVYQRTEPVDPATLKPYPLDLIHPSRYDHLWSVVVSRGCPHKCDFCTVPRFFRNKYRSRPVAQIVAEIAAVPDGCWVELHADNLTADRKYALELFRALEPLNISWFGEATIQLADDEELLKAAADSGCRNLMVGVETSSKAALEEAGKKFVSPETVREKIRRFHAHGIEVSSSMIFGFDAHTPDIFRESAEFCRFIELDEVESVILIPFPGTPLYRRLAEEGRILSEDWSEYDGAHAVYEPGMMTPDELLDGADWFWREIRKRRTTPAVETETEGVKRRHRGPRLVGDSRSGLRWRSILALVAIGVGLVFDLYWIWGLLFLVWAFTDLRNGFTYLLEDIPRSESPILYWLVVSMWLLLGVWTLAFTPGSPGERWLMGAEAAPVRHEVAAVEQVPVVVDPPPAPTADSGRVYRNRFFDYGVVAPAVWSANETIEPGYATLDLGHPDETGNVTVVAMDLGRTSGLADFTAEMEPEILRWVPGLDPATGRHVDGPAEFASAGFPVGIREYRGVYEDYPVVARVGFGVKGKHGFLVLGMHGHEDRQARTEVLEIMESFVLGDPAAGRE